MNNSTMPLFVALLLLLSSFVASATDAALTAKVTAALNVTDSILRSIYDRWQIDEYPNFLRSVAMSRTSWEVMKVKYQLKVLRALLGKDGHKFVISYLGSSVTAGHDTLFNLTFSEKTYPLMGPPLEAAGIKVEVINGAMGNNPCMPYDVCVRTFAGPEADIVHWEQSFNCFGSDDNKRVEFEQFIRQSMNIPTQPVVVFSESSTPNWGADDCKNPPPKKAASSEEKKLLELLWTEPVKIVSEINKNEPRRAWSAMLNMFQAYKGSGVQMWSHDHYQSYKCHGPYVKNWGCCSASWHPSLLGHELRAAHYSFFWLLVYKDALKGLLKLLADTTPEAALQSVQKHSQHEHNHNPAHAMYKSTYSDKMQCLTAFEPRADPLADLAKYVVDSRDGKPGFVKDIFENIEMKGIIDKARKMGYKDYKYAMMGNKESGTLSIKITVGKSGTAHLCQPPGVWGKLPNGYRNFWEVDTKVFLTENTGDAADFAFSQEKAKVMEYVNRRPKDTQNVCVEFVEKFPAGSHVVTVVPTTESKIMISTILVP